MILPSRDCMPPWVDVYVNNNKYFFNFFSLTGYVGVGRVACVELQ